MMIPILSYHSINNQKCPMSLDVNDFEDQLIYLKKNNHCSVHFNEINNNKNKQFIMTFDDGYKDIIINCLPLLKKYNFKAICYIVSNNIGKTNKWDFNKKSIIQKELMSKNDLHEWVDNGMLIGSHSHDHADLTALSNKEISYQVIESKKVLQDLFGFEINSFSYPFGKHNLYVKNIVKNNYLNAVTTNRSRFNTNKHNLFSIPRIDMGKKQSNFMIYLKLRSIYEDIKFKKYDM